MLSQDRIHFLARLPLLLTSSLDVRTIVSSVLRHVTTELGCEASALFLRHRRSEELIFWSLEGEQKDQLQGKRIGAGVGIVGWVTTNRQSALVNDVANDPRFFSAVDTESGFKTRSILCIPLVTRGETSLGAIQALNKRENRLFDTDDQEFLEQVGAQVALAVENAQLFEETSLRARQLAVLDRRKQDMLAVITHEFRTPLNVIRNAAEMILDDSISKDTRVQLGETLERGVQRLSAVISRLKNVQAITNQSFEILPSSIDVEPFLRELISQFEDLSPPRDLRISLSIADATQRAQADRALVSVALRNLLTNAIRFTPDGGRVVVGTVSHPGLVEFFVSDTGIGIDAAESHLIFEKFYEVAEVDQHSSGSLEFRSSGLGLGLAAVKSIVEAHGSTVVVSSALRKGSRFSFCVPTAG